MKYYILFGPPGAGKGTQAGAIARRYNLCHLSTGELLRAEIAAATEPGMLAKALIDKGDLVPDEIVEGMLQARFASTVGVDGFLLDGFPRNIAQAEDLDRILAGSGDSVTKVLSIMIPDAMVFERIAGRARIEGRADDADAKTIQHRIDTYHSKTEPLVEYYKNCGKYAEVDGTLSMAEVEAALAEAIER